MNISKNINQEFHFYIHVHATKYFLIATALLLKKKNSTFEMFIQIKCNLSFLSLVTPQKLQPGKGDGYICLQTMILISLLKNSFRSFYLASINVIVTSLTEHDSGLLEEELASINFLSVKKPGSVG